MDYTSKLDILILLQNSNVNVNDDAMEEANHIESDDEDFLTIRVVTLDESIKTRS